MPVAQQDCPRGPRPLYRLISDTAASAPPKPLAMAMLRWMHRRQISLLIWIRCVGKGESVRIFGGIVCWRCDMQLIATEINPAAPRLCPSAPLWE